MITSLSDMHGLHAGTAEVEWDLPLYFRIKFPQFPQPRTRSITLAFVIHMIRLTLLDIL